MATRHYKVDPVSDYHLISGERFTLRVKPEALRILGAFAKGLPQRGLEIGGLLLGSDTPELQVDEVHPVATERLFGPSYELADSDNELIRETVTNLQLQSDLQVIGHFRSYPKGELEVTSADRTIAALTGSRQPLMLLIGASSTGPVAARLYRERGGDFVELLAFGLTSAAIESPTISEADEPLKQTPSRAPELEKPPNPPRPPIPDRRDPTQRRYWWKAFLFTGLLACAASVSYFVTHRPPPDVPKDIGFSVVRSGEQLIVSWDRSSATVRNGISGLLTIQDGHHQSKFQLTPSELRSETVAYVPETATVEFTLDVYRDRHNHAGDSMKLVSGPSQPIPEQTTQARVADRPIVEVAKETPKDHTIRLAASPVRRPRREAGARRAPKSRPPAMEPPRPESNISPAPLIADLPAPDLPGRPDVAAVLPTPQLNLAPPPKSPAPPAGTLRATAPRTSAPLAISYVAPVPLRKTSPAIPTNLRSLIQNGVSIEVKVIVDAAGGVINATPVNASSPGQKLLSSTAAHAAMLWRFEPARRDGQPVSSETILKFNFEPQKN